MNVSAPVWVREMLEARGIPFEELHHPDAFTAQQVAQHEHFSGHRVAKVVVAMVDGRPVELILPASRRVRLDRVRDLLGAGAVRLASEDEIERIFTDCETGAIPALRHWRDVEVLMDAAMNVGVGDVLLQAGTHHDAVRMRFDDWFNLVNPRVGDFSEPSEGPRP